MALRCENAPLYKFMKSGLIIVTDHKITVNFYEVKRIVSSCQCSLLKTGVKKVLYISVK